ncbi:MAG: hypothetical protein JRJ68_14100 [Deltaproteobacteria bacterium]|nr:hypothetical protein [Deltaproteobacteria bacterium]
MDNQSNHQPGDNSYTSYQNTNHIDLARLLVIIKESWKQCLFVIFACTLLSLLLAVYLPKTYEVESILLPPEKSNIDQLIIPIVEGQSREDELTRKDLYSHFLSNLQSNRLQNQFLAENSLSSRLTDLYNKSKNNDSDFHADFKDGLTVEYIKNLSEEDYNPITVTLSGAEPDHLADLLNEYITFVDGETVKSAVGSIQSRVMVSKKSIEDKISSLRAVAEDNRRNTLDKIKENLAIAEKLNILEPITFPATPDMQSSDRKTDIIEDTAQRPDYLKGVNALKAEMEMVVKRKNNDPYIAGLLKLRQDEKYLNHLLNLKFDKIHAANVDKVASRPLEPVRPMKILYVLIGFFFGLLISIFIVLIKNIIYRLR